ncbi:MAG: protein phosphatase CheZ [Desulfovibrio sp.]|jgi:chemotaxis protein CheZ|nr:protein phosphatase CheZ [Desulfovibrio sp.]
MISQEQLMERVIERVADAVAESVKQTVVDAVQRELSAGMAKAAVENEFYRKVNDEMLNGLRGIYREISSASTDGAGADDAGQTQQLFSDASRQLEEITATTLQAAENIMETVETLQEQQLEAGEIIASIEPGPKHEKDLARLDALNQALEHALTKIVSELSFQDLTGQRLKKVVAALGSIRETVFDLYVSTGLMMKTREETPEKDIAEIAADSRRRVAEIKNSELKGPQTGTSQAAVDELLAGLGL